MNKNVTCIIFLFYRFMVKTFGTDPDYWDVVAKNEFSNKSLGTEKQRIKYEYILAVE